MSGVFALAFAAVALLVPAVSAELVGGNADGLDHIVEPVEAKRREIQLLPDRLDHIFVAAAVGIRIFG